MMVEKILSAFVVFRSDAGIVVRMVLALVLLLFIQLMNNGRPLRLETFVQLKSKFNFHHVHWTMSNNQ